MKLSFRLRWGRARLQARDQHAANHRAEGQCARHSVSVDAPVNVVPVANHGQNQQQKRDQQQTRGFGGINRMPVELAGGVMVGLGCGHESIVAPVEWKFLKPRYR